MLLWDGWVPQEWRCNWAFFPQSHISTAAESSMSLCMGQTLSFTVAQLKAHMSPGTWPFYFQWCCFEPPFKAVLNSEGYSTACSGDTVQKLCVVNYMNTITETRDMANSEMWGDIFVQPSLWGKSSHYGACLTYSDCLGLPCTREVSNQLQDKMVCLGQNTYTYRAHTRGQAHYNTYPHLEEQGISSCLSESNGQAPLVLEHTHVCYMSHQGMSYPSKNETHEHCQFHASSLSEVPLC